jgi:hypothetical protein
LYFSFQKKLSDPPSLLIPTTATCSHCLSFLGLRKLLQHGNQKGHHKGTHVLQHEISAPHLSHGLPNLIHNLDGTQYEYGSHAQGDVYGTGSGHIDAFTRRSFTDVIKRPVNMQKMRSGRTDRNKFTSTEVPQFVQHFHSPVLTKSTVVSG